MFTVRNYLGPEIVCALNNSQLNNTQNPNLAFTFSQPQNTDRTEISLSVLNDKIFVLPQHYSSVYLRASLSYICEQVNKETLQSW